MTNSGLDFISNLLLKNHISLRNVYDFADLNKEKLQTIERIFDLSTEDDKKLCLAVFKLIAPNDGNVIPEYFCKEYDFSNNLDDLFFEQNRLLLIAAFIYNSAFFAMAWNLCGLIKAKIADKSGNVRPQIRKVPPNVIRFPQGYGKVHRLAASGSDDDMHQFGESIKELPDAICGELQSWCDNSGNFQFLFISSSDNTLGLNLKINFTVDATGDSRTVLLDRPDVNNNNMLWGAILSSIDCSCGITVNEIEVIEI